MARTVLIKGILFMLSVVVTTIVGYYLYAWLGKDVTLKYAESSDIEARIGPSHLDKNLVLQVSEVNYRDNEYEAIRVIRFRIFNESSKGLKEDEQFVLVSDDDTFISGEFIVDITCEGSPSDHGLVMCERSDIAGVGPGFKLKSDFPGKSYLDVFFVFDIKAAESLANVQVTLNKIAKSDTRLEKISSGVPTVTFNLYAFVVWLIVVALTYSAVWMGANVFSGNYTVGAKATDWVFRKLTGRTPLANIAAKRK